MWKALLTIRRVEYFIAELPILLIPALLTAGGPAALATPAFAELALVMLLLFNLGDMANCLADRDLDERHKPHLARAVRALGTRSVTLQILASGLAALALACHLGAREPLVPLLVVAGIPLGAAYSLEPIRLKRRGLLHLATQWLVIFCGPMLLTAVTLGDRRPLLVLAFAAAFGALQEGIILVNCAEDYPEDRAAGVRTTIVALGLRRGLTLAARLAAAGAAGLCALVISLAVAHGARLAPLILPALVWWTAVAWLATLARDLPALTTPAVEKIRRFAKYVPVFVTAVAWSTALAVAWAR